MGNLFASTRLGDEKPHERDVEYCGFAGRRPYERQNENPETPAVHTMMHHDVTPRLAGLVNRLCVETLDVPLSGKLELDSPCMENSHFLT